ncbi:hypothetical protein PT974_10082 [Cladobotryum mycophilum]|uniref:F-box domain-containing protein n=1 Tax=Cladobotryum mycophilum TaxID=491253 RepID=A0ABR0SAB1_9HYPO
MQYQASTRADVLVDEPQTPPGRIQDSLILQLPVELIHQVSQGLPLENQIVLSQTCSAFKNILDCTRDENKGLSRIQRIRFLSAISRSMPDKWVCIDCLKLHRIWGTDVPSIRYQNRCPKARPLDGDDFFIGSFELAHRHLQTTLKLSRLVETKPEYRAQLDRLLEPHHCNSTHMPWDDTASTSRFSVYPKVVDGKYLLHCVWRQESELSYQIQQFAPLTCPPLCRHQLFPEPEWPHFEVASPESPAYSEYAFIRAIRDAYRKPGVEVRDACAGCATDFAVRVWRGSIAVDAWMDLGPEGTAMDWDWRVFVHGYVYKAVAEVPHIPNRVRELYEKK